MPEHASRISAALYDQQNEDRVADWGGDELFTRMPRPRAVDDAPAPRFRPSLVLVDPPEDRRAAPGRHPSQEAMSERGERLGLAVVDHAEPAAATRLDPPTPRVTGRPDSTPRPLPLAPAERRRAARTPVEWIGPRPERIMAWAFALGLLLILIAISTA